MPSRRYGIVPFGVSLLLSLGALLGALCAVSGAAESAEELSYRRDVLPILSDRCFACHGPDSATREAGLRLDQAEEAIAELDSGARAIVPGSVAESSLIERIESTDEAMQMPPVDSGKSLSAEEKAILRKWIDSGAEYEAHWAFAKPERPGVPEVASSGAVANPIDAFVVARLEPLGMELSPPASKERLLRRLYFDLIGLPPTLEEIDAYLADESPEATDRVLERLFNSPHYGERMAADWLDGARYADSNGYQNDFARSMSPWRDWVIAAFNAHMPYDQFITEQLAGDLLPNPTLEQRIATGFNRNHRMVTEAGSIEEEWHVENVVDRVETFGTVMLGLTVGCARCHDHKFDPISQREFYQLFAFFNNVNEKGVYTETRGNVPPLVKVVKAEDAKKLAEYDARIATLSESLTEQMAALKPLRESWIPALAESPDSTEPQATIGIPLREDGSAVVGATGVRIEAIVENGEPQWTAGLFGSVPAFADGKNFGYTELEFPPPDRPFSWAVWVRPEGSGAILAKMDDDRSARGCELFLAGDAKVGVHLVDAWPSDALKVLTKSPLPRDRWSHITMTYDGSRKGAGVKIYVNGELQELDVEVDQLSGSFATEVPLRIGRRSKNSPLQAALSDVRLYAHALPAEDVAKVVRGSLPRVFAATKYDALDEQGRGEFDALMLRFAKDESARKAGETKRELATAQEERGKYEEAIPTTMVMEERSEPRPTYLLDRGQYDKADKSEVLSPEVPAILSDLPEGAPHNRLGLAQWLVDGENPLTARVIVNRMWQRFFGLGLVKTPENFGVQAEAPSHPELLDWLATELIRSGWNLQHIQRLIVTSNTYRQQSEAPAELYESDPENRLLARGPRHRLPAEAVRDGALAVSGLLVPKIGGPSVMPYQPEGLWEELQGGAFEVYTQGHGDDLYRRSLYVYRKRTVPHPSLATFDAPSWEICQVKRTTTNTPLQALALLNDVTYVEAARKFAERILKEGGSSQDERLTFAFRLATGRAPVAHELSTLRVSLEKYRSRYRNSPGAAEQMVSHGEAPRDEKLDVAELAAHTAVASILLNLDETVSKN